MQNAFSSHVLLRCQCLFVADVHCGIFKKNSPDGLRIFILDNGSKEGTYIDGEIGWKQIAQEFVQHNMSEEVTLYQARGGTVVEIEYLADTNPEYLKSAGGTMVRLFFLAE